MARYPGLSVVYAGHPLMLAYLGTPASPRIIRRCRAVIRAHAFTQHYTFRFLTGYLDSQRPFWKNPSEHPDGPIEIAPQYGFWSCVYRYKPDAGLYPTYSTVSGNPAGPRTSRSRSRWRAEKAGDVRDHVTVRTPHRATATPPRRT